MESTVAVKGGKIRSTNMERLVLSLPGKLTDFGSCERDKQTQSSRMGTIDEVYLVVFWYEDYLLIDSFECIA